MLVNLVSFSTPLTQCLQLRHDCDTSAIRSPREFHASNWSRTKSHGRSCNRCVRGRATL